MRATKVEPTCACPGDSKTKEFPLQLLLLPSSSAPTVLMCNRTCVGSYCHHHFVLALSGLTAIVLKGHCCFLLQRADLSADQRKVLAIMERTFKTYITEDQTAIELKEKLNQLEAKLAENR